MKKIFLLLVGFLFMTVIAQASSVQINYDAGNIWTTSVSDTTTASGRTLINGSAQQQFDIYGNKFTAKAFQVQAVDDNYNALDFFYSFFLTSPGVNLWKGSVWGPMQRTMNLPPTGIYVYPTFTAQGVCTFYLESLQ